MRLHRRDLETSPPSSPGGATSRRAHDERLLLAEGQVGDRPGDPRVRLEYAAALIASRPQQAAAEALRAVELDERGEPMVLLGAALVLVGARDLDSARACAARAAERAPTEELQGSLRRMRARIDQIDGRAEVAPPAPPVETFVAPAGVERSGTAIRGSQLSHR